MAATAVGTVEHGILAPTTILAFKQAVPPCPSERWPVSVLLNNSRPHAAFGHISKMRWHDAWNTICSAQCVRCRR